MNDLISRQAAIDAFYKYPNIDWTTLDVLAKINALPSAQLEIIKCKDCKYCSFDESYERYWCNRLSGVFRVKQNSYCSWAERKEE